MINQSPNNPPAPAHLRPATQRWWDTIVSEFDLDETLLPTLQLAAETWDRYSEAREALATHGTVYTDRFGQPKKRPEVDVEKEARIGYLRAMRELGLDVDGPAEESPRPPELRGRANLRSED